MNNGDDISGEVLDLGDIGAVMLERRWITSGCSWSVKKSLFGNNVCTRGKFANMTNKKQQNDQV